MNLLRDAIPQDRSAVPPDLVVIFPSVATDLPKIGTDIKGPNAVKRGKETLSFPSLKLTASVTAFSHPFLGVLPVRDDPEPGEEIRYVFAPGPAEAAKLKPGDRILKIGMEAGPMQPFSGRDQLTAILDRLPPGTEVRLEIQRKGDKKTETVKLTLGVFSEVVPETLPEKASRRQALAPRQSARVRPPGPVRKEDKKEKPKEEKKKPQKKKPMWKAAILPSTKKKRDRAADEQPDPAAQ